MTQEQLKLGMIVTGKTTLSCDWDRIDRIKCIDDKKTLLYRIGMNWYKAENITIDWYCIFMMVGDGNIYHLKKPFNFIINGKERTATHITTRSNYRVCCEGGWEYPIYELRLSTIIRLYDHLVEEMKEKNIIEVKDKNGKELHVGDIVKWYDPEVSARDLTEKWEVWYIDSNDMVCITSEHGSEAEVYPEELKIVKAYNAIEEEKEEEINPEVLCYGREDLMKVAESIANELGDINIAEDLCQKMAESAVEFVKHIQNGGTYSVTPT